MLNVISYLIYVSYVSQMTQQQVCEKQSGPALESSRTKLRSR